MLSYGAYAAITFGPISLIIIVGSIVLLNLSLHNLVRLLESVFRFKQVRSIGNDYIVIDVSGDQFEISKAISSRLPFVFTLGVCILVTILVFIEGCIFSTRHIYSTRLCPDRTPNCYLFNSHFTTWKPVHQYVCETDKPVIPANMSQTFALCYGFVLPEQTSIDILNQLGVCTGILSLIDSIYPVAYSFGHRTYGKVCLILLLLSLVVLEITVLAMQLNITFMSIILLTLAEVLLINIFVLYRRKVRKPANLKRVGSYIELKDLNND